MNLKLLADRLISGDITIPEWQIEMKEYIRTTHRMAVELVYGGVGSVPPAAWGYEGYLVKLQYQYLDKFVEDIRGNPSAWMNGRLFVRMDLYRKAEWSVLEQLQRFKMQRDGWTQERRELGEADHCSGCLEQAGKGWQPINTLPWIGSQECSTNCHCVFWYRKPDGVGGWVLEKGQ